ncbi:hypothetical protein ACFE04_022407 [Oxalis oulophora]
MTSWFESSKKAGGKTTVTIFDNSSKSPRICKCNAMMKLQISGKPYSYGRRFFSCSNSWEGVGGCGFFLWFDPPEGYGFNLNDAIVQELKDELNEVKMKSKEVKGKHSPLHSHILTADLRSGITIYSRQILGRTWSKNRKTISTLSNCTTLIV